MDELTVVVGGILIFFGMLIGSSVYGDSQENVLRLECIKQHGDWIGKGCVYREHK